MALALVRVARVARVPRSKAGTAPAFVCQSPGGSRSAPPSEPSPGRMFIGHYIARSVGPDGASDSASGHCRSL